MIDHNTVCLGKKAAVHDMRVPLLKTLMSEDKIPADWSGDWLNGRTKFPMGGNDEIGLCTSISKGHGLSILTGAGRKQAWDPTTAQALAFYKASTGNNPPKTDDGGVMLDVLKYMLAHGWNGWRIQGFAVIGRGDTASMRRAIYYLGFADIGISLPASARKQAVWDVPKGGAVGAGEPGSWGGHDALLARKDPKTGLWGIVTWDYIQPATDDFIHAYVDEAYGWKSKAFEDAKTGLAPNQFDDAALDRAMRSLSA